MRLTIAHLYLPVEKSVMMLLVLHEDGSISSRCRGNKSRVFPVCVMQLPYL
jgi:hypothetical protein